MSCNSLSLAHRSSNLAGNNLIKDSMESLQISMDLRLPHQPLSVHRSSEKQEITLLSLASSLICVIVKQQWSKTPAQKCMRQSPASYMPRKLYNFYPQLLWLLPFRATMRGWHYYFDTAEQPKTLLPGCTFYCYSPSSSLAFINLWQSCCL